MALSVFQFETKFRELEDADKFSLGAKLGELLLGTSTTPEQVLQGGFLLNHNIIIEDVDPMLDQEFCMGIDSEAMLCGCCGWYCPPDELNDNQECMDCTIEQESEE